IEAEPAQHQQRVADAVQDQARHELHQAPCQPVRRWPTDQQADEAPQLHFTLQPPVPVATPAVPGAALPQPIGAARRSPRSLANWPVSSHTFRKLAIRKEPILEKWTGDAERSRGPAGPAAR